MVNRLSPIELSLSTPTLRFKPGGPAATFAVTVVNASDDFATVVVDVDAPSAAPDEDGRWYRLTPEVGTKTPPGDRTQFNVEIFKNPVPGFVGTMNLTVQVLFLELPEEAERKQVRLVVEAGIEALPLKVSLPVTVFTVPPQAGLEIPVELHNPGPVPVTPTLGCQGLPLNWSIRLPDALPPIPPGEELETVIRCQLPDIHQVPSQVYPFAATVSQAGGISVQAQGDIQVLPRGDYAVDFAPLEQDFPRPERAPDAVESASPSDPAVFGVAVESASNLAQQVSLTVTSDTLPPEAIAVTPKTAPLGVGETAYLDIQVAPQRPLLGWPRAHTVTAQVELSDPQLEIENDTRTLRLWVKPRLPFLLQVLGIVGLVAAMLLPFWFASEGHSQSVNQLQLSGDADRIFSGSSDQTVRRWRVEGDRLKPDGVLADDLKKAVRVVELRPLSNDVLAMGFENGEISLWDVLSTGDTPLATLVDEQSNRVLDLEFSDDARTLFSSHGSGAVLQWALGKTAADFDERQVPAERTAFDFAVYALAGVGDEGQHLAVAGRYNRLVLWNWQTGDRLNLSQNPGDQNDYIQSLDVPDRRPDHLAVADNRGGIQLWEVSACLTAGAPPPCATLLESWNINADLGEDEHPKGVRSLAYTPDGCYLVSVGDDRRVRLWPLAADGRRDPDWLDGKVVRRSRQKLNTVDAILNGDRLLVSSGGDDHQVRLDTLNQSQFRQPGPGQCNAAR